MIPALASPKKPLTKAHTRPNRTANRLLCAATLLVLALTSFVQSARAADTACTPDGGPAGRPAVGLVLSGGGARGYAHLGVLKVLEENRIPVEDRKSTRLNSSHDELSRMPSSA